ncbi:MAG: hypothetical protein Q4G08_09010 [Capnocytophaga sp.]|nr:hypothetical protein [Capnocytophaga sp.]
MQQQKENQKGWEAFLCRTDFTKTRFVNERCFAWIGSFGTLFVRFGKLDKH